MAMKILRPLRLLPLLAVAGLLLTSCASGSPGQALPAGSTAGATVPAGSTAGATVPADSTADQSVPAGGATGSYDEHRTVALDMSVRIANTYLTPAGQPSAIDVWAGSPTTAGRKLITVPYGTVSPYFAPEVPDPYGQGLPSGEQPFTLTFLPAGTTAPNTDLGSKSETSQRGLELTMVMAPADPTAGSTGASMKVYADSIGATSGSGGFTVRTLPTPAAGQSVLLLDALALQGRAGMTDSSAGLTPSGADGKCLPYYETGDAGIGYTGKLHDMKSDVVDFTGGTSGLAYQVPPGSEVRLNQPKENQRITESCADVPVLGPFDPKLAAGAGAYGILYGPDLAHAKILIVPVS